MVYSQRHTLHFEVGLCGMETAILLLLTLPFAAAVPIASTHTFRGSAAKADSVPDEFVQDSGVEHSQGTEQVHHAPALKIIPFLPDDDQRMEDALKRSVALRLRVRRAPQRGCQLGTCQLHNLANTLYHISKTNGKDESKKANDPQGYGR